MTTAVVSYKEKVASLRSLLDKNRAQFQAALPKHLSVERMLRVMLTAVQRTPQLLDCTQASLFGALLQSAQLGLEPDGVMGHAYLIPFWNSKRSAHEAQFLPGYKGLIDLARRSGTISTIEARVVHDDDVFHFRFGLEPQLEHVPKLVGKETPTLTAVYALCRLRDGGLQFEVMSRAEVEAIRERSRAKDSGPWKTDYEAMAKKTVLRRLVKLLPTSIEAQRAVALDEAAEAGIPQDLEATVPEIENPTGERPAPKHQKIDQLADQMEAADSAAPAAPAGDFALQPGADAPPPPPRRR
jgi:recombination protein RecT